MPIGSDQHGVPPHRHSRNGGGDVGGVERTSLLFGADDGLEVVAVKVEGVLPGVIIIQDDLDHVVLLEHQGVAVGAVDGRIGCGGPSRESGVQRWDLGSHVGDVVEEGTRDLVLRNETPREFLTY